MFLSKVTINPAISPQLYFSRFGDMYKIHKTIYSLFGSGEREFLFKILTESMSARPFFYILSSQKPNAELKNKDICFVSSHEYDPQLAVNTKLRFSLRVNPVVTRTEPKYQAADGKMCFGKHHMYDIIADAKNKAKYSGVDEKKVDELAREVCTNWLAKKGVVNGFTIDSIGELNYQVEKIKKPGGPEMTFGIADIEGILTVTKPEVFIRMLFKGIGKARGFGCGLMLIKRL